MRKLLRYRPSPAMAVALIALVVAAGGVAFATIPDSEGVIHGCYDNRRGTLRVIDTEASPVQSCRSRETALSWNQQGPKGDTGPTGPEGPAAPGISERLDLPAVPQGTPTDPQTLVDIPGIGRITASRCELSLSFPGQAAFVGATYTNTSDQVQLLSAVNFNRQQEIGAGGSMSFLVGGVSSDFQTLHSSAVAFLDTDNKTTAAFRVSGDSAGRASTCRFFANAQIFHP